MSGTERFNLNALRNSIARTQARTRGGVRRQALAAAFSEPTNKRQVSSVFKKRNLLERSMKASEGMALIRLSRSLLSSSQKLSQAYVKANAVSSKSEIEQFLTSKDKLRKAKKNKRVGTNHINAFLNDLNKICGTGTWRKVNAIVNGTPDTPYYVPIDVPVIVANYGDTLPLGFSYDPIQEAFRIFYLGTGDVMFNFVYVDAIEALKGRSVHLAMLDWASNLSPIAEMYQKWYEVPAVYAKVYRELHKAWYGEEPVLEMYNPEILSSSDVLARAYPDWVDQRHLRNLLLTTLGDLGGVKDNSGFDYAVHNAYVQGQKRYIGRCKNVKNEPLVLTERQWNNIPDKCPSAQVNALITKAKKNIGQSRINSLKRIEQQAEKNK